MSPISFLVPLGFRSLALLLPQTFFQPDEFYQALEPAHHLVFGYGFLSWEWRDLPGTGGSSWWVRPVAEGRMRGWIWPGVYAGAYKCLRSTGLSETSFSSPIPLLLGLFICVLGLPWISRLSRRRIQHCLASMIGIAILAAAYREMPSGPTGQSAPLVSVPRMIGVSVAAITDYYTARLSEKLIGKGSAAGALFLSLTSLFNAHLLPRSLSTSAETMLVTIALVYCPLPRPSIPRHPDSVKHALRSREAADTSPQYESSTRSWQNYVVMDRLTLVHDIAHEDSLAIAAAAATLAACIRPTTLPLWAYLGADLLYGILHKDGIAECARHLFSTAAVGITVLAASTALDFAITGRFLVPVATFIHRNVFENVSSFYGSTNLLYHATQSLPIMLFPIWCWWGQGFASCLLPRSVLSQRLGLLDRPEGLRTLARAITFTIAILSLSPHSEWRFLHPLLPALLLFALPPVFQAYRATVFGLYHTTDTARQYVRFGKLPFYLSLFAPILPYLYLDMFHGRAQVEVMNVLRELPERAVTGVVALMPCHSTPWMSHLHKDIPSWFLTCEPPLNVTAFDHVTQQDLFYASPVSYLERVFPYPPVPLHQITSTLPTPNMPSHVILFGSLLGTVETGKAGSVQSALESLKYEEVWSRWNGFDWAQDEALRRGGVRIWQLVAAEGETQT